MPNVIRDSSIPNHIYEAYSTQAKRQKYPDGHFLLVQDGVKKFPYKAPDGVVHEGLLRAAIARAAQYGYSDVESKASEFLEKHFTTEKDIPFAIVTKEAEGSEVFGIVASPDEEPDVDGHYFTKEALKEMCYDYNLFFKTMKYRHGISLKSDEVALLESYIAPCDMVVNGMSIKEGAWLQRWKIDDPTLKEQIKTGHIKGFSLGGYILAKD